MNFADTNFLVALYSGRPADHKQDGRRHTAAQFMRKHGARLLLSHVVLVEARNIFSRLNRGCPFAQHGLTRDLAKREPQWTESIAVGSEDFVRELAQRIQGRQELEVKERRALAPARGATSIRRRLNAPPSQGIRSDPAELLNFPGGRQATANSLPFNVSAFPASSPKPFPKFPDQPKHRCEGSCKVAQESSEPNFHYHPPSPF
jgi:hypothetical protein